MMMSRELQAALKRLIPSYYLQNLNNLRRNETASALLAWAAFRVSTSISFVDGEIEHFNTDKDVFWNFPDPDLRKAVVFDGQTAVAMRAALTTAHERLSNAGDHGSAAFFAPDQVAKFQELATNHIGDRLLQSLLITEAGMVRGAAEALAAIQDSLSDMPSAPTKAVRRLADFGAKITQTFNSNLSVYGDESLRTLSSMLLASASGVLDSTALSVPKAMLNLYVLNSQHEFDLTKFLAGDLPSRKDVAVAQTLTNLT